MFVSRRTPLFCDQAAWRAMGSFYGTFLFHFPLFDSIPLQYGADHSAHSLRYACPRLVSTELPKADRRESCHCSLDQWFTGHMLHPGPGGLDVRASVFPVVASAGGTPRA